MRRGMRLSSIHNINLGWEKKRQEKKAEGVSSLFLNDQHLPYLHSTCQLSKITTRMKSCTHALPLFYLFHLARWTDLPALSNRTRPLLCSLAMTTPTYPSPPSPTTAQTILLPPVFHHNPSPRPRPVPLRLRTLADLRARTRWPDWRR